MNEREIHEKIEKLKELGLIEIHPDDRDKPWEEQRLRRTPLGEAAFVGIYELVRREDIN